MHVYLNGRMVRHDRARLGVGDAGLQHAVGLFETLSASRGRPFRLRAHVQRLLQSAAALDLAAPLDAKRLQDAVIKTLKHNGLDAARVRLTVTAGPVAMASPSDGSTRRPRATVLVVATAPRAYDPAWFQRGVRVVVGPPGANPFDPLAGHKTLAYWARLRTLRHALAAGAAEAVWLNVSNHLASGAISNIFLVKDEELFTPIARGEEVDGALPAPVLPGITRAAVLELAQQMSLPVQRRMLSVNDLLEADEVFLTNSGWHVLPVTSVEKESIANGKVGPITRRLREAMLALIDGECGENGK